MSEEQTKEKEEKTVVTLDANEFNDVCRRVHNILVNRADRAWKKHQRCPTKKTIINHIEASKDAFAFEHVLELIEHMSEEIHDLREIINAVDAVEESEAMVAAPQGKQFLN